VKQVRQLNEIEASNFVWSVAFSLEGKHLAYGTDAGVVTFIEVTTGKQIYQHGEKGQFVNAISFLPGGTRALFSKGDRLHLVDFHSKREIRRFEGHAKFVTSVAVSASGKQALSGSWDGNVLLWDIGSEKLLRKLEGGGDSVHGVAFLADGKTAVSASGGRFQSMHSFSDGDDNALRISDVVRGKSTQVLKGHTSPVRCVAASPDGRVIVSGAQDGSVLLWEEK